MQLKVAVIGAGSMGMNHLRVLKDLDGKPLACCPLESQLFKKSRHDREGKNRFQPAAFGFIHIWRADKNRQAFFGAQISQQIPKFAAADGIHSQSRLIQHNDLRFVNQTASERKFLLHPTR
jgi:hypothetical protein